MKKTDKEKVIEYTDLTGVMISSVKISYALKYDPFGKSPSDAFGYVKVSTTEVERGLTLYDQRQDASIITIENIKIRHKYFRNTNSTRVARFFMLFHPLLSLNSFWRNHLVPIFCSYTSAFLLESTAAPLVTKPT